LSTKLSFEMFRLELNESVGGRWQDRQRSSVFTVAFLGAAAPCTLSRVRLAALSVGVAIVVTSLNEVQLVTLGWIWAAVALVVLVCATNRFFSKAKVWTVVRSVQVSIRM